MGRIDDEGALRDVIGEANPASTKKDRNKLDKYDRMFLAKTTFVSLGTVGEDGQVDVSVRGDPPGFVQVLDEATMFIPERPGNRRADTLTNLLGNPAIGIVAFLPGMEETLRLTGQGVIVDDADLLAAGIVRGRVPKLGIQVTIDRVFFHCGKAIKRSDLWGGRYQIERSEFPPLAQILHDQAWGGDVETIQREIDESYSNRMY